MIYLYKSLICTYHPDIVVLNVACLRNSRTFSIILLDFPSFERHPTSKLNRKKEN